MIFYNNYRENWKQYLSIMTENEKKYFVALQGPYQPLLYPWHMNTEGNSRIAEKIHAKN